MCAGDRPKGVIDLTMCISIKEIPEHQRYDFLFAVYTKARNYYLAAASSVRSFCVDI